MGERGEGAEAVHIWVWMLLGLRRAFQSVLLTVLGVLDTVARISRRLPKCSQHSAVKASRAPLYGWGSQHRPAPSQAVGLQGLTPHRELVQDGFVVSAQHGGDKVLNRREQRRKEEGSQGREPT